jgi:sugar lactone lactonase YvrE
MRKLASFVVACAAVGAPRAFALSTEVWKTQSAEHFRAGKLERVVVSSEGEVSLGRRSEKAALDKETLAWCVARDGKGAAWVGTGPKGAVYRLKDVDGGGPYTTEKVYETGQFVVTALAVDGAGQVYAGTIPEGKIYRIDAVSGKGSEYATLPAKYVWALVAGDGGKLFAATGPEGKLFAVEPGGKVSLLHDSKERHLLSLARDKAGNLYAGSSPKGILFRVAPDGKATAVNDFDGDEVRAIALYKDELVVAVNSIPGKPAMGTVFFGAQPPPPAPQPTAPGAAPGAPAPGQPPRPPAPAPGPPPPFGRPLGEGALYRIDALGHVELVLKMPRGYFTSVAVDDRGNAYAGSGAEGRVYMVTPSRELSVVFDFEEKQVLALDMKPSGAAVVGTGNGAMAYVTSEKQAKEGTFFSRVFDARFPARWGNLTWRSDGRIVVRTRSGNTEAPDAHWSDWSDALDESPSKVQSAPARYLQYRVDFGKDRKAVLREVQVYYLQQNQRARITLVRVGDQPPGGPPFSLFGGPPKSPFAPPPPGAIVIRASGPSGPKPSQTPPKGQPTGKPEQAPATPSAVPRHDPVRKISWSVENPDGDPLVYWVYVKEQGGPNWILLNQKEPLTSTDFRWNTESVPDGNYVVKVKVSDERGNPQEHALTHERVSAPVLVDNRKPEFADVSVDERSLEVTGVARDSFSAIRRIEYSVDGGDWNLIYPADGLYDDKEEKFRFLIRTRPASGPHTLTLRAYDSDGNIGTANLVFRVP